MKIVLCVDDDPGILSALERVLRRTPFEVVAALGPEEGLKLAETVNPDIILLDMKMPGMSGPEFMQEVRKIIGNVPVVFITGMNNGDQEAKRLGAGYYIRKPFSNHYVRNVVEMLIGDISEERRLELIEMLDQG
ncbi:MAG: response regulator [Planctomycetes bacterium]|nr:response regulator [Planctomycetota bacterium]